VILLLLPFLFLLVFDVPLVKRKNSYFNLEVLEVAAATQIMSDGRSLAANDADGRGAAPIGLETAQPPGLADGRGEFR